MTKKYNSLGLVKQSVTEYLDAVSYDHWGYVPTVFATHFINFIKMVNGKQGEEHPSPVIHYRMMDALAGEHKRIANLACRGFAKTSLFCEYLILYIAVYGGIPGIPYINALYYVSDSMDNGVRSMRKNLEARYNNSEFLKTMIPKVNFIQDEWEFTNVDGLMTTVLGAGAKSGVRGKKVRAKRPRMALLDDLISDSDARSPIVIDTVKDVVYKAVDKALDPIYNCVIWNGTPFNERDPLYEAIESGAWYSNVYPICEKFPCTKEEFRGGWEERFSYEYVANSYERALLGGKVDGFFQELMLRIMSDDEKRIPDRCIQWYSRDRLLKNRSYYNYFTTTDFSTAGQHHSDNAVAIIWAINHIGDLFLVDGFCDTYTMDISLNKLFDLVSEYKPMSTGIEVSGQQEGFIPWIYERMQDNNIFFNLASHNNSSRPGLRPSTNKEERFEVVVPWFLTNKFYFPEELRETKLVQQCLRELSLVTGKGFKSKNDDCLDNMAQLPLLGLIRPTSAAPKVDSGGNDIISKNYYGHDEIKTEVNSSYVV